MSRLLPHGWTTCRVCNRRAARTRELVCGICEVGLTPRQRSEITKLRVEERYEFLAVCRPAPDGPAFFKYRDRLALQAAMANLPEPTDLSVEVRLRFVTPPNHSLSALTTTTLSLLEGVCFHSLLQVHYVESYFGPVKDHERVEINVLPMKEVE